MEYHKKICKSKQEFEYEKKALETLQDTGIAPQLYSFDESSLTIIMEKITLKTVDIYKILTDIDSLTKFACAERNLELILSEKKIAYHDWKDVHTFYDTDKNFLRLIDYSGDDPFELPKSKNEVENFYSSFLDMTEPITIKPDKVELYKDHLISRFG